MLNKDEQDEGKSSHIFVLRDTIMDEKVKPNREYMI